MPLAIYFMVCTRVSMNSTLCPRHMARTEAAIPAQRPGCAAQCCQLESPKGLSFRKQRVVTLTRVLASREGKITNWGALLLLPCACPERSFLLFFSCLNVGHHNFNSSTDVAAEEWILTCTFSMKQMPFLVRTGIFLPLEWSLLLYA